MNRHKLLKQAFCLAGILLFLTGCGTYGSNAGQTSAPPTQPIQSTSSPDAASPVTGSVQIEQGQCCISGVDGTTVQVHVQFTASSKAGQVNRMRVDLTGSGCAAEPVVEAAGWEPFVPSKSYPVLVGINWSGFDVSVQYQDEQGNLSPVYCDDISVEGMPAVPVVNPTDWYPQIQCFSESDVHPSGGETVTGPTVTFTWPNKNDLPEGVFYKVNAYGASDSYTALIASGQTRDTSLKLQIPSDRAGDIVWYVTLVDVNGAFLDHGQCSSFAPSLLTVNPPSGIKGAHFQYQP